MISVNVALGSRSYPILIGSGLLQEGDRLRELVTSRQVMIVTNDRVGPIYCEQLARHFEDRRCARVILPDGETHKTLGSFNRILTALLEQRFERSCIVIALGGGVIGDVAGFAAACYQRGVRYLQIPTTLLAQVDSSVGGKTAVNHPAGKNMIGAFHQPLAVISDLATLSTLEDREFRAGIAEIIKYGLIQDLPLFLWLEEHLDALLAREPATLTHAIRRSCENKASVVAADEHEGGVRALLNLGHTFGHAIEHGLGYGVWLHGEAVAAGMCMAADLSTRLRLVTEAERARIVRLIARAGLPTSAPPTLDAQTLLAAMQVDKKNRDGRIRLVLMKALGAAFLSDDYAQDELLASLSKH